MGANLETFQFFSFLYEQAGRRRVKREERRAQKEAGRCQPPLSPLPSPLSLPGRRVRAITFDVGGTLIKPWPSVGHIYSQVAARHGFPGLSVATLNRQFIAAWDAAKEFDYSRLAWAQLVDETFRGLTDKPPSQTFFAKLYSQFAQPEAWRVFEDVVPALEALASLGIRLGVI